eukprot:GHRR01033485.1.p1 GENE.GHRR01033485.1~~GHRR01033485.1.p1  ORF type:complete len:105 (-),score=13.84 GHRR01033485.1:11-325(-)
MNVATEVEMVREALGACALPDAHNPVLVGVEHLAHFAHWLRVSGAGGEVTSHVQATKQSAPAIVAVSSVGQAPRHKGLALHGKTKSHITVGSIGCESKGVQKRE